MSTQTLEIEGTWEDILSRSADFAGRRVRLIVYTDDSAPAPERPAISAKNQRMLETYKGWLLTPLTDEEVDILDEFEQFRKHHPVSLRQIKAE